jgi:hypothetical protein
MVSLDDVLSRPLDFSAIIMSSRKNLHGEEDKTLLGTIGAMNIHK